MNGSMDEFNEIVANLDAMKSRLTDALNGLAVSRGGVGGMTHVCVNASLLDAVICLARREGFPNDLVFTDDMVAVLFVNEATEFMLCRGFRVGDILDNAERRQESPETIEARMEFVAKAPMDKGKGPSLGQAQAMLDILRQWTREDIQALLIDVAKRNIDASAAQ
jgi:hypothetical protein